MYKDRGIIKWAPFDALIGFNEAIKELLIKKMKIEKPILLEDRLEEMERNLKYAFENKVSVHIDYYEDGFIKSIYEYVIKIDSVKKIIKLGSNLFLSIDDCINIEIESYI